MQRARSLAEARLYMDRVPCVRCARRGFVEPSRLVEHGEELAVASHGYCPGCGAERAFEILLAEARVPPGAWGNDEPSTLLDAGDWMAIAEEHASAVPAEVTGLDAAGRAQAATCLATALAALDEVLKFIPAKVERVDKEALFGASGRDVYLADPGRFSRVRIAAVADAWRALLLALG
jgi:hypothetical protein